MASSRSTIECEDPIAVLEFSQWHERNGDGKILLFLITHDSLCDGSLQMDMSFSSGETFSLICPDDYPNIPKPLFQIRQQTDSLTLWANSMNEFASNNRGQIKLAAFFNRALETFGKKPERHRSVDSGKPEDFEMDLSDWEHLDDDEDEDDEEEDDGMEINDDEFTTGWEIQMDLRKKRWIVKEKQLRSNWESERRRPSSSQVQDQLHKSSKITNYEDYSPDNITRYSTGSPNVKKSKCSFVKEGQQIFTHESAAFQILSSEMIHLLKHGHLDGFTVDTVDDSLYTWTVKINSFPHESDLHRQLLKVCEKFGYQFIQVQLDFVPDFPFYPPLLRVVRPRLKGSLVQSLANIDLLKVTYWNPTRTVQEVLRQIKSILLRHAQLDVTASRNDPRKHPEGAYHPIENQLIKLALSGFIMSFLLIHLLPSIFFPYGPRNAVHELIQPS